YILFQGKKPEGVIVTFVEITAIIEELRVKKKLIADYEILLDTNCHDIKNPLTNLILAVGLLKKTKPVETKKYNSLLETVDNALCKMHALINDLAAERKNCYDISGEEELLFIENILED